MPHVLARQGLRLTRSRRAVLDLLAEARAPLTVAEIHAGLGTRRTHVVSVYRTVHLLVRLGLVRATDMAGGSVRYELNEPFSRHHHHLICQGCGRIEDLDGCVLPDRALVAVTRAARRARQFRVTEHELRLFGRCRGCAA